MREDSRAATTAGKICGFLIFVSLLGGLCNYFPYSIAFWACVAAPAVLTLGYAVLRRKLPGKSQLVSKFGFLLAAFTLLCCAANVGGAVGRFATLGSTEDPSAYERVRGSILQYPDGLGESFFPKHIPNCAKDIVFHYNPQILQGGSVFRLEFSAPPEEIEKWERTLRERSSYPGSYTEKGLSPASIWDFTSDPEAYPEEQVYLIAARNYSDWNPVGGGTFGMWNHGSILGGVVSREAGRVCFYSSQW